MSPLIRFDWRLTLEGLVMGSAFMKYRKVDHDSSWFSSFPLQELHIQFNHTIGINGFRQRSAATGSSIHADPRRQAASTPAGTASCQVRIHNMNHNRVYMFALLSYGTKVVQRTVKYIKCWYQFMTDTHYFTHISYIRNTFSV